MNLERTAAVIRPRQGWESTDLGFAMVRHWWRVIYASWITGVLPIWLVLFFALRDTPWLSFLLVWWLKPIFDRIPLSIIGRGLFGEEPDLGRTLRGLPKLLVSYPIAGLTIFRLDAARSYNLPVWQLEGLRGMTGYRRVRVLCQRFRETAIGLTLACWIIEFCVVLSLLAFGSIMVPEQVELGLGIYFEGYWQGEAAWWCYLLVAVVWFVAVALVEPFYVAAGFALYLNRRIALEGWDVELAFRRLRRRLAAGATTPRSSTAVRTALLALLASASSMMPLATTEAGALEGANESPGAAPAQLIEEILERPEFGRTWNEKKWEYVGPTFERGEGRTSGSAGSVAVGALASLLKVLLWLAGALALSLLLYQIFKSPGQGKPAGLAASAPRTPDVLFGLDVRTETLPRNLSEAALELLRAGKLTEALSLLYRGTLAQLVKGQEKEVSASWTEGDCLRFFQSRLGEDQLRFFRILTDHWCKSAYAHRQPAAAALEELCLRWDETFRSTS